MYNFGMSKLAVHIGIATLQKVNRILSIQAVTAVKIVTIQFLPPTTPWSVRNKPTVNQRRVP